MPLRVLITGTNRGIGLEFVRQYLTQGAQIFAAARQPYSTELSKLAAQHPSQLLLIPLNEVHDDPISYFSKNEPFRQAIDFSAVVNGRIIHVEIDGPSHFLKVFLPNGSDTKHIYRVCFVI